MLMAAADCVLQPFDALRCSAAFPSQRRLSQHSMSPLECLVLATFRYARASAKSQCKVCNIEHKIVPNLKPS